MKRVWIAYEPRVFREVLMAVIGQLESVEIVEDISAGIDIGIFRLAETGLLQNFFLSAPLPEAKLVVFSSRGDRAFIRNPHETNWTTVQPFSMPELLAEITRQN